MRLHMHACMHPNEPETVIPPHAPCAPRRPTLLLRPREGPQKHLKFTHKAPWPDERGPHGTARHGALGRRWYAGVGPSEHEDPRGRRTANAGPMQARMWLLQQPRPRAACRRRCWTGCWTASRYNARRGIAAPAGTAHRSPSPAFVQRGFNRQRRLPPNLLELWRPFRQQYASRLVQLELRHLHAPWARLVQQVRGAPPRLRADRYVRPLGLTVWIFSLRWDRGVPQHTGVNAAFVSLGAGAVGLFVFRYLFQKAASLVVNVVGFLYPAYQSLKVSSAHGPPAVEQAQDGSALARSNVPRLAARRWRLRRRTTTVSGSRTGPSLRSLPVPSTTRTCCCVCCRSTT